MTLRQAGATIAILFAMSGCAREYASPEDAVSHACSALGPKATSGALIGALAGAGGGAAIGAAAGNGRGAAIGAGVGLLVGVMAGLAAGNHLDQADCQEAQAALQRLAGTEPGTTVNWSSNETGSHGAYRVGPEANTNGRVCRTLNADYYIKGHEPVLGDTGLVCRTSNGDWARVKA